MSTAVNLANATSTSGVTNPNSASAVANPEALVGTGSETSASRFKVEEVPNYEPILFTTSESGMNLFPVTTRNFSFSRDTLDGKFLHRRHESYAESQEWRRRR